MWGQAGSWSLLGGSRLCCGWHFQVRSHIALAWAQECMKCVAGKGISAPCNLPGAPPFTLNSFKYLFQLYLASFKTNFGDRSRRQWDTTTVSLFVKMPVQLPVQALFARHGSP